MINVGFIMNNKHPEEIVKTEEIVKAETPDKYVKNVKIRGIDLDE